MKGSGEHHDGNGVPGATPPVPGLPACHCTLSLLSRWRVPPGTPLHKSGPEGMLFPDTSCIIRSGPVQSAVTCEDPGRDCAKACLQCAIGEAATCMYMTVYMTAKTACLCVVQAGTVMQRTHHSNTSRDSSCTGVINCRVQLKQD